jgi:hypothetical protein
MGDGVTYKGPKRHESMFPPYVMPKTPVTALMALQHSRDAEQGGLCWNDDGATVTALARLAGVQVQYVHVELGHAMTVEYRTVNGQEAK